MNLTSQGRLHYLLRKGGQGRVNSLVVGGWVGKEFNQARVDPQQPAKANSETNLAILPQLIRVSLGNSYTSVGIQCVHPDSTAATLLVEVQGNS